MRLRNIALAMIIFLITPLLSGCWDAIELEEEGYVAAIGVDKGRGNMLKVTYQITNPKAGATGGTKAGGGTGNEKMSDILTTEAPGILVARDTMSVSVTRKISLAHAKIIVVGEEFAKTPEFFHYMEAALREKEMRRSLTVMVCREEASEFINNNKPTLEDRPQKFYEFMSKRWKETGLVPSLSNLNRFMQRTEQGAGLFLSIYGTTKRFASKDGMDEGDYLPGQMYREGGNPAEMIGSAVFKNGVMIGKLNGDETRLVTLLRPKPEVRSMLHSFPDPIDKKKRVAARVLKEKNTKVDINIEGDKPKVNVTVPISIDVLGIGSFVGYPENLSKQDILKQSIEEYFENESMRLVRKTQQEYKGEPFLWGLPLRKKFLTYDEYKKYDWMSKYPGAEVKIHFDVKITGFGKQLNPPESLSDKEAEDKSDKETY